MIFEDLDIQKLNLESPEDFSKLIIEYLCGESQRKDLEEEEKKSLLATIQHAKTEGINRQQFNEILLLLEQDRISKDFFEYFFTTNKKSEKNKENVIKLSEIRDRIQRFRGYAMLCFGNFRFAYKDLMKKDYEYIRKKLCFCQKELITVEDEHKEDEYEKRLKLIVDTTPIDRSKTWYTGYFSQKIMQKHWEVLEDYYKENIDNQQVKNDCENLTKLLVNIERDRKRIEKIALRNTITYLTWDYMDVYIATSMRNKWEYEEVFDFTSEVFKEEKLNKLNLRYFDPTQSLCVDRIDKGLIEGLMLKRAKCTIYLAQELDTMGKDSELAATLAQEKPVIAYVPEIDYNAHLEKIRNYPTNFFIKRLHILIAEDIFEEKKFINKVLDVDPEYEKTVDSFFDIVNKCHPIQFCSLFSDKDNEFKNNHREIFEKICKILTVAEQCHFDNRADTLREKHPLAIQVALKSGVANGVLIVRNSKQCAELLYSILTNSLKFTIKFDEKEGSNGMTKLIENISGSTFRVVTHNEKLTNSFWNFYLDY